MLRIRSKLSNLYFTAQLPSDNQVVQQAYLPIKQQLWYLEKVSGTNRTYYIVNSVTEQVVTVVSDQNNSYKICTSGKTNDKSKQWVIRIEDFILKYYSLISVSTNLFLDNRNVTSSVGAPFVLAGYKPYDGQRFSLEDVCS